MVGGGQHLLYIFIERPRLMSDSVHNVEWLFLGDSPVSRPYTSYFSSILIPYKVKTQKRDGCSAVSVLRREAKILLSSPSLARHFQQLHLYRFLCLICPRETPPRCEIVPQALLSLPGPRSMFAKISLGSIPSPPHVFFFFFSLL